MRFLVGLIFVAASVAADLSVGDRVFDSSWEQYKLDYAKHYPNIETEESRRLIWEDNVMYILQHNIELLMGLKTYELGMNQFADLTNEEFTATLSDIDISEIPNQEVENFGGISDLPDEVDWRTKGLVTPVKDQGDCGSCWSFSTTGALEGQHANKTGQLVSLSEQNLLECDTRNKGCDGGNPIVGFIYIKQNGGIDTEESYPYVGKKNAGSCKFDPSQVGATVTGWKMASQGDEQSLQKALARVGPISVLIDASKRSFQLYKSGVYYEPTCSTQTLNHAVLAVGYGTDAGDDYWIVKNSWAARWGEAGYIRMARNKKNMCGIATVASYPTV